MTDAPLPLSWDAFALRIDLDHAERIANRELERRDLPARDIALTGEGPSITATATVEWQVLAGRVAIDLCDLRLGKRHFGCRIAAVRGPLGLPLPVDLVGSMAQRFGRGIVRYDPEVNVLLVDLRTILPAGVDLALTEVRVEGRSLVLELAGGGIDASCIADLLART